MLLDPAPEPVDPPFPIALIGDDRLALIPARDDVVDRPRILDSQQPRHVGNLFGRLPPRQPLVRVHELTPRSPPPAPPKVAVGRSRRRRPSARSFGSSHL